jgi:hypothetical protein
MTTALYGIAVNMLWIIALIKNIKLTNKLEDTEKENTQLKDKISNLERSVREEANKNIILESILRKQKNQNQNEDRRIY